MAPSIQATRATQGLWRLARLVLHIVRGVWQARRHFPRLDAAQRQARISAWSRCALQLLRVDLQAGPMPAPGPLLIVANHVSWLDIVVLHALCPQTRFVAKKDLAHWPLVRELVAAADTLLVDRDRPRDAARAVAGITQALRDGHTLALFPEGTTSDGRQLLGFRSSLLEAAVAAQVAVQPVLLRYAEQGQVPSGSVPYIGRTTFVASLWRICRAQGLVACVHTLPAHPAPHADRRALTRRLHAELAAALALAA